MFERLKTSWNDFFSGWLDSDSDEKKKIGFYGPPNGGKTTLSNRFAKDLENKSETSGGSASPVPHETREVKKQEGVQIEHNGNVVEIDIFDTPGVTTKVDMNEFVEEHNMEEDDAERRSREAASGVTEALRWLRSDTDGVIYVLDSTRDPVSQVNQMITGIIESEDTPVLIAANKIDKEDSDVEAIREHYDDFEIVEISAKEGENMDELYERIAEKFG